MKLNDLGGIYDRLEMAANRQREIFEEMIAKVKDGTPLEEAYIAPQELEEHAGRLEFAYTYLESVEFKYLTEDLKDLIRLHVKEREKLMQQAANPLPAPDLSNLPVGLPGAGGAITPELQGII
jgi:hypothetical protein